jgi:hypothetical protein
MYDLLRNNVKVLLCPVFFDIRTSFCLEVPSLRPLFLAGMVLTGKKRSIRRNSCLIATCPPQTSHGLPRDPTRGFVARKVTNNPRDPTRGFVARKVTNNHGTPVPSKTDVHLWKEVGSYFTLNKFVLPNKLPIR